MDPLRLFLIYEEHQRISDQLRELRLAGRPINEAERARFRAADQALTATRQDTRIQQATGRRAAA